MSAEIDVNQFAFTLPPSGYEIFMRASQGWLLPEDKAPLLHTVHCHHIIMRENICLHAIPTSVFGVNHRLTIPPLYIKAPFLRLILFLFARKSQWHVRGFSSSSLCLPLLSPLKWGALSARECSDDQTETPLGRALPPKGWVERARLSTPYGVQYPVRGIVKASKGNGRILEEPLVVLSTSLSLAMIPRYHRAKPTLP